MPVVALTAHNDGHGDARHRTNHFFAPATAHRQSAIGVPSGRSPRGRNPDEPRPIPCRRLPGWCLYRRLGIEDVLGLRMR